MEIVSFKLAKKLKEKGFRCKHPIAMYNEDGMFCPLYTSADHNEDIKCIFGNREYYDYDDFDSRDFIAPTISQVLKWLREEKKLHIVFPFYEDKGFYYYVQRIGNAARIVSSFDDSDTCFDTAELAALAGIKYCLDNLI